MSSNDILNDLIARQEEKRYDGTTMQAIDCAIFFRAQMENYKRSVERAHKAMDESGFIAEREKTHQGLTPRINAILHKLRCAQQ